ncbi:MAG: peptidoglycan DD-metalloendopeptidase family protein [Anaerolineae bacterium]
MAYSLPSFQAEGFVCLKKCAKFEFIYRYVLSSRCTKPTGQPALPCSALVCRVRTAHQSQFKHRFYDSLSRLNQADYNLGDKIYNYGYDVAGNLVDYDGVNRTFNAANQMTNDGTNSLTYDNNGNLRTVGSDTYTWDRANRLANFNYSHFNFYDGLGNRVQTLHLGAYREYVNDVAGGLIKVLVTQSVGGGQIFKRYVHAPRAVHSAENGLGDWSYYAQDGLGSVRAVVDDSASVERSMAYDPYGNPTGSLPLDFGFTGEQTDENGSVFLRARYYEPELGVFNALDPFEGLLDRPMSLNGYSWVHGNPVMNTDPTGKQICPTECEALREAGIPWSVYITLCTVRTQSFSEWVSPVENPFISGWLYGENECQERFNPGTFVKNTCNAIRTTCSEFEGTCQCGTPSEPISDKFYIHPSIDLGTTDGVTPILAVASGTVTLTEERDTGYGHRVEIQHQVSRGQTTETWYTQYAHLSSIDVKVGDIVSGGTQIGVGGNTGNSSGSHLDFQIRSSTNARFPRSTSDLSTRFISPSIIPDMPSGIDAIGVYTQATPVDYSGGLPECPESCCGAYQ